MFNRILRQVNFTYWAYNQCQRASSVAFRYTSTDGIKSLEIHVTRVCRLILSSVQNLINQVNLFTTMNKLLRSTLQILGAVIALLVMGVVVVLFMVAPDQYRSVIEDAVYDATGLQLNIAGDMSLSYQPYVGVTLNDVRLRNPDRPQELASASVVSLRVNPRELLAGRLLVEELHADGFHFNWYVDGEGNSWWMTERLRQADEPDQDFSTDESAPVEVNFSFISISNASADLQNLQQGYFYSIRDLELSSQNSNAVNQPFPLQANFELIDPTAAGPWPITLSSSNRIDLENGNIEISDIQLAITPALLQGRVQIQNLFDDIEWEGRIVTNEFALNDLLDNLLARQQQSTAPELPGFRADRQWQSQLQIQLSGDTRQIEMPELIATLGDMRLEMEANVRFARDLLPTNFNFSIATNNLDLSPYLPLAAEPVQTDDESFGVEQEATSIFDLELPKSLWPDMNAQGSVSIDSLFTTGIQFGSISLSAIVESGMLDLEIQPINVLNGSVEGNLRVNSIPARSEVTLELVTNDIDVANLPLTFISPGAIAGRLNLESRYSGSGGTLGEWLNSFAGASSFTITDNAVDISVIKQTFTAIAALSPTGEAIQQWPDVIRFNEFNGYAIFEDGLDNNQQIKLQLDNFDITGTGGIELDASNFNYDLVFTVLGSPFLQTIPINEQYHDVSWPVRCAAQFSDPINQYCRPDLAQVREIFTQLSNTALQDPLDEEDSDQAPETRQDSNRGLLRNLFQN